TIFVALVFEHYLENLYDCFNHPLEVDLFIPKIKFYSNFQMGPPLESDIRPWTTDLRVKRIKSQSLKFRGRIGGINNGKEQEIR
ncbi:MAG TPA: hypothetical protein VLK23_18250, partial [Thermodesulfobacteriota bacterium]|nr:hypothetical protein [Thermodesulfobacteriota bacterium]